MRSLLFFDLPTKTVKDRRSYRKFVKEIKKEGFIMYQESVYIKLSINEANVKLTINHIKKIVPTEGKISILTVTEKQFNDINVLLGEFKSETIVSDKRYIEL